MFLLDRIISELFKFEFKFRSNKSKLELKSEFFLIESSLSEFKSNLKLNYFQNKFNSRLFILS